MDLAALRAEIKSWERAFKAEHQRTPTLDDIKALPKIAAKYKLHKKLSKEAASLPASIESNGVTPSTPPRRSSALPGPSSLLPKSRAIAHSTTDATPNPFSPSKASRRKLTSSDDPSLPKLNFLQRLSTPPRKTRASSTLSPEPFPPIESAREDISPLLNSAIKRARKRLRGDLVSPSPKKPRTTQFNSRSEIESDADEEDTSYIDDSPIKVSKNGKDFKSIFEEGRLSQPDFSAKKGPFSHTKCISSSFGIQTDTTSSRSSKVDPRMKRKPFQGEDGKQSSLKERQSVQVMKSETTGKHPYSRMKSDLRDPSPSIDLPEVQDAAPSSVSRKRLSSIDVDDNHHLLTTTDGTLLPPSPSATTDQPGPRDVSGKSSFKSRKKAKLTAPTGLDDEYTDDEEDLQVVELDSRSLRKRVSQHIADDNDDDEIRETLGFISKELFDYLPEIEKDASDGVKPEINLPEDLRSVLHISSSRRRAREEKALVESLLQGKPSPLDERGEVWGIGEVEDAVGTTTDDEWAGEGVPWEVGEL